MSLHDRDFIRESLDDSVFDGLRWVWPDHERYAACAPGFFGQFHLAIVVSLLMVMPLSDISEAKAAAIVLHLVSFAPISLVGLVFMAQDGLSLFGLKAMKSTAEAAEAQPVHPTSGVY